jgi:hypothetical protein
MSRGKKLARAEDPRVSSPGTEGSPVMGPRRRGRDREVMMALPVSLIDSSVRRDGRCGRLRLEARR